MELTRVGRVCRIGMQFIPREPTWLPPRGEGSFADRYPRLVFVLAGGVGLVLGVILFAILSRPDSHPPQTLPNPSTESELATHSPITASTPSPAASATATIEPTPPTAAAIESNSVAPITSKAQRVVTQAKPKARPKPAPPKLLTDAEARTLATKVLAVVEDYARPSAVPASMQPHLGQLVRDDGIPAALAVRRLAKHARQLLEDLEHTITVDTKRVVKLIHTLRGEPKGETRFRRYVELLEKKLTIRLQQRERLTALARALSAELSFMRERPSQRARRRLLEERHVKLTRALSRFRRGEAKE